MNEPLAATLQRALDRWQHFAPAAGANVTVLDGALGAWHGASGVADVDSGEPMAPGARAYVYSITKTFTAAIALRLAERRTLDLDEPLERHLPGTGCPSGTTLRRLLNHTAGVPSYTGLPDYADAVAAAPGTPWTLDEVIGRCCRDASPDFAPGTGWCYSNTGHALARRSLESASGRPFAALLHEEIAGPLGLDDTADATEVGGGPDGRPLAPGYDRALFGGDAPRDVVPVYHPHWCLTGLVASTTADVARFLDRLFAGEVLAPASLAAMRGAVPCEPDDAPTPPGAFFRRPAYGLGLMIDESWPHGGFHGHGGDGPGFNTFAMHLPRFGGRALTLAVFCNTTLTHHPIRLCRILLETLSSADPTGPVQTHAGGVAPRGEGVEAGPA